MSFNYHQHQIQPPPPPPPPPQTQTQQQQEIITHSSLIAQAQGRVYTVFVCSYIVSGQLLNLALEFPERPLHSEVRARVVNAFRAEEAAIIDRSQSIAFDVALLFIYDTDIQRWRPLQPSSLDMADGCQLYAQPRISSSVVRSICDNADALEMQRIPPPVKGRLQLQQQQQQQQQPSLARSPPPHQIQSREEHNSQQQIILSSDDDDDNNNNTVAGDRHVQNLHKNKQQSMNNNNYNGTDLALAESWDEACRTLFQYLDDDHDGLVDISEIPATLERISSSSSSTNNNNLSLPKQPPPPSFIDDQQQQSHRLRFVDETSFVAFCCRPENAGIVSGLLAFIHQCNKARQDLDHHQKILDRIHKNNARGGWNQQFSSSSSSPQQQLYYQHQHNNINNSNSPTRGTFRQGDHYNSMMFASSPTIPSQQYQQYQHQTSSLSSLPPPQQSLMYSSTPRSFMSSPPPLQQQQQQQQMPRQHVLDPLTLTPTNHNNPPLRRQY